MKVKAVGLPWRAETEEELCWLFAAISFTNNDDEQTHHRRDEAATTDHDETVHLVRLQCHFDYPTGAYFQREIRDEHQNVDDRISPFDD